MNGGRGTVSRKQKEPCFPNYSDSNKNSPFSRPSSPAVVWQRQTCRHPTAAFSIGCHPSLVTFPSLLTSSTTKNKNKKTPTVHYFKALPIQGCQHASPELKSTSGKISLCKCGQCHTPKTNSFKMIDFLLVDRYQPLLKNPF